MTTPADTAPEPPKGAGPEEIEADIEATRERLGETVDALTQRMDVKARVKHKADETKQKALNAKDQAGPALPIGAAFAVALVIALVVWRKRR